MMTKPIETSPELLRLLEAAKDHKMTEAEIQAQRESWVRGMTRGCEHGVLDFEQCPDCIAAIVAAHTGDPDL